MVPAEKIIAIEIEKIEQRGSGEGVSYHYPPTLVFKDWDGSTRRDRLVEWSNEASAEEFAAWLRGQLHG